MSGISLLSAMTAKMQWHQQRQNLLAENVANADTPNYRGQELKPLSFGDSLGKLTLSAPQRTASIDAAFLPIADSDPLAATAEQQLSFEVTPEGNGVTLEDEMMKVTANQMDFQTVTSLYTKSLALLRTALGR